MLRNIYSKLQIIITHSLLSLILGFSSIRKENQIKEKGQFI